MSAPELFQQARSLEGEGKVAEAVRAYRKAAQSGSGPAAKRLGEIYDKGQGDIGRDYQESLRWYEVARRAGQRVPIAKGR